MTRVAFSSVSAGMVTKASADRHEQTDETRLAEPMDRIASCKELQALHVAKALHICTRLGCILNLDHVSDRGRLTARPPLWGADHMNQFAIDRRNGVLLVTFAGSGRQKAWVPSTAR